MNNDTVLVAEANDRVEPIVPMTFQELLRVAIIGLMAGLIAVGVHLLLKTYVFERVMCTGAGTGACDQASVYSMLVGMVVSGLITLVVLVKCRIFRPLLVVLSASIALWGYQRLSGGEEWYIELGAVALFFCIAFMLFAWLARVRSFVFAAILCVAVAVCSQLILAL